MKVLLFQASLIVLYRFVIILGQSGGCVSVLDIDNGEVLWRTQAHNGQKVTKVQVYPENNCLLSAGIS